MALIALVRREQAVCCISILIWHQRLLVLIMLNHSPPAFKCFFLPWRSFIDFFLNRSFFSGPQKGLSTQMLFLDVAILMAPQWRLSVSSEMIFFLGERPFPSPRSLKFFLVPPHKNF